MSYPPVSEKWDRRWLTMAALVAAWSKDHYIKVGCVVVRDRYVLATGYNGFPRGVPDVRLEDREYRRDLVVHAEANAIIQAGSHGASLVGASAYVTWPPCPQCAGLLIQAGVVEVVMPHEIFPLPERWRSIWDNAFPLLRQAAIRVREVE